MAPTRKATAPRISRLIQLIWSKEALQAPYEQGLPPQAAARICSLCEANLRRRSGECGQDDPLFPDQVAKRIFPYGQNIHAARQ